jgi:hypothetical protein
LFTQLQKPQFPISHQILGGPQQNAAPAGFVVLTFGTYPHRRHTVAAVPEREYPGMKQAHGIERTVLILRGQGKQYASVVIQRTEKPPFLQRQMHTVRQLGIIQDIVNGFSGITQQSAHNSPHILFRSFPHLSRVNTGFIISTES